MARCALCGRKGKITKHHIVKRAKVKNMSHTEKFLLAGNLNKTVPLCWSCHRRVHREKREQDVYEAFQYD